MRGRRHMGLVAAVATLMASAPLVTIFEMWTWLIQSGVAVALVAGAATLARTLRAPVWAQLLAMIAALALALTWMFPSGDEFAAVLPWTGTLEHFAALAEQSGQDMRTFAVPVPDSDALLFVTTLGIGAVAVMVDFVAVGLRRPALAGLPMLAVYSVPVAVYSDSVAILPFIVGAMGFLWLLVADNVDRVRRFGRRFTGDGRDVDVWEPSPLAAAGRRLAVIGVVVAIAVPMAIPGMTTGILERFNAGTGEGTGPGDGTGRPGRINLFSSLAGQLQQTEMVQLARVSTNDPDPFYLRFAVADDITSEGFRARVPNGRSLRTLADPQDNPRSGVIYREFRATVEMSNDYQMQYAPVYGQPTAIDGLDNNWLFDNGQGVVYSNRANASDRRYEFDFVRANYTADRLREAPPLPPDNAERERFASVPSVREVTAQVRTLTEGHTTTYDKVMAIYRFFSAENDFTYDLQTVGGTSGEDIVNFLNNRKGFCQQYASAMAWLVRAAGIPARVAFGFTNGTTRDGDAMILTNLNLHAWTEVYFGPEYGWVPFDATPRASVPGAIRPGYAPDPDEPDVTPSAGPSASPGAGSTGDDSPLTPRDEGLEQALPGGGADSARPTWPLWTAAGILAFLLILALPGFRRAMVRRRRHTLTAAGVGGDAVSSEPGVVSVLVTGAAAERRRADAHAAWDELIDTMIDFRVLVDPTETPRTTAERLAGDELRGADSASAGVRLLGHVEERARYARSPVTGEGLPEALRAVRRGLAARSTRRARFVAAVMPPSVLGRWRAAVVDSFMSVFNAGGAVRERALRLSPRRLLSASRTR